MFSRHNLGPELQTLASEVFNRSWQFVERDPCLAGEDREDLQDRLAELILVLMRSGEKSSLQIANKAISSLRQQCARHHNRAVELAA